MQFAEVRAKFPQYDDLTDDELASAIHKKFYSDVSEGEFRVAVGLSPASLSGKVGETIAPSEGVSPGLGENVSPLNAQQKYDFALKRVRETYYPQLTDEQWAQAVADPATKLSPYGGTDLLDTTMGLGDEIAGAANALGGPGLFSGNDLGQTYNDFQDLEQAKRELGVEKAGWLGTAGQVGGALLSGRPDMATQRAAGLVPSILQGTREAAAQGGLYGFASTEGGLDDRAGGAMRGAAAAAPFGAAFPAVVAGGRRLLSPITAPPAKTAAANVLQREGVELTAGQATGNKGLQYREAELGGAAAEDFMERQADQFTGAVLRRAGINANRATTHVVDQAFTDIGQQFDDLAARNVFQTDPQFLQDLQQAFRRFDNVTNANTRAPFVERFMQDMANRMRTGYAALPGDWFKATRSELARISRSTTTPELKEALRDIMEAMDDAMERGLAHVNPADLGAWREARRLYRNMIVIEDAITRAGEKAADGIITPANIRAAAMRQNKRAFARGRNEFTDLANAGVSTMTPLPQSGTPGRIGAKMFIPAGGLAGATLGSSFGPLGTIGGGVLGSIAPWAIGRAMLSGPGRRYLGNQLAAGPGGGLASLLGASFGRGEQPLLNR